MKAVATKQKLPHSIDSPAVPPGYKQTDLGVIPEHWHIRQLVDICMPRGIVRGPFGGTLKKDTFVTSGFKVYEQQNAIYKNSEIGSYFVDQSKYTEMHRFSVSPGDFIISCSGTIGRIFQISPDAPQGVINQALLKLTTDDAIVYDQYFYILFEWDEFQIRIIESTQGGAMKNLVGMDVFRTTTVVLPPLPEQRAIAEALSDVDGLLNALEALIAKKQAIKQATMQQLLTGKTRLHGFSCAWETKQIGDVVSLCSGKNNLGADIPVLTCSKHLGFVDSLSYFKNQVFSKDLSGYKIIKRGQIGYPINHVEEGSIGLQDLYDVALVSPIYVVCSPKQDINSFFLHRLLKLESYRQEFANATMSSINRRGSLRWSAFSKIHVTLPPIDEQVAVAAVLNDVETEIAALEKRRDKTRAIKQGMMQLLLTGRVRLVKKE